MAGSLVSEHMLLGKQVPRSIIKKLAIIDTVYVVAAILIVVTGFTMWFAGEKETDFYTKNPIMHIKFTIFLVLGIMSIWPTVFFIKNKKGDQSEMVDIPKRIFMFLRIEILLLFVMPYLAVLIARGISF